VLFESRPAFLGVADVLVEMLAKTPDLDRLWLTDVTEHPTSEGKL
jgi:hypothetical protein